MATGLCRALSQLCEELDFANLSRIPRTEYHFTTGYTMGDRHDASMPSAIVSHLPQGDAPLRNLHAKDHHLYLCVCVCVLMF